MKETRVVSVGMGKVAVAREGETLTSILGSCVGIGILMPERNLYGLAHCLLPESPAESEVEGARFVNQAVPYLIEQMGIMRSDYKNVEAIVIGGANLLSLSKNGFSKDSVGSQNIASALKALARLGIKIVFENVGDNHGRQLTIDGQSGTYEVQKIVRLGPSRRSL